MTNSKLKRRQSGTMSRLLIVALLLTLAALSAGLQFIINTTGGTLFLFAAVAPALVLLAIAILGGVLFYDFKQRHRLFEIERYEPGQVICRQGDVGDSAYFIRSGEVEVVRETNKIESVIAKLRTGQYFGETALLSNEPRNATVRAAAVSELAVLGKENFLTMLSFLPSTQVDILKTVQERAMRAPKGK
jgi:CRP-like cAMP-binding protein